MTEIIVQKCGFLERPGIPTFTEFVYDWLPREMLDAIIAMDGGRQGANAAATLEMTYPIFVAMKAGNPLFRVAPELIMALRDTEIPELPIEMLKTPFEGIRVNVPRGTFAAPAELIDEIFISHVAGDRFRVAFSYGIYSHYINILTDDLEETILSAMSRTTDEGLKMPRYLREEVQEDALYADYFKADVFRFAVNLALYITSPDADMYQDKTSQQALHQKLQGLKGGQRRQRLLDQLQKEKEKRHFVVGANLRLQKEYTATLTETGKKWMLKHRFRVIGHWRQQAHGPERALRKPLWIQPFFKGPTYAEMVEKGYVLR